MEIYQKRGIAVIKATIPKIIILGIVTYGPARKTPLISSNRSFIKEPQPINVDISRLQTPTLYFSI